MSLIDLLCPELQEIYFKWVNQCEASGLTAHAIVTWRSAEAQNEAKAQGLSNAGAGESPHNCCTIDGIPASRAFDYGIFNNDGSYVTSGTDPRYGQAAQIGKSLGLVWGGDWINFKDYDHLEMSNWKKEFL